MQRLLAKRAVVKQGDKIGTREVLGQPFLAALKSDGRIRNRPHAVVKCSACGKIEVVVLHGRSTTGCDCRRREALRVAITTHGLTRHPLHSVWKGLFQRCYNPNFTWYCNYGGRGIRVCDEWQDFRPFYEWATANGYAKGLEIDRVDNDGHYGPTNCRFVTRTINSRNKRTNRRLTAFGETKTLIEWTEDPRCVVALGAFKSRISLGWSVEVALTTKTAYTPRWHKIAGAAP